jgi:hypothetical protein
MEFIVLLVDAEGPLTGSPRDHLRQNETWDLSAAPDDALHLMVQTMEAWIVAHTNALAAFYGQAAARGKPGNGTQGGHHQGLARRFGQLVQGPISQNPPCRGIARRDRPRRGPAPLPILR